MSERVELSEERQREIVELESRLVSANPFRILSVSPQADRAAITAAYHEASLKFHPDRYFGKELGSFRSRLDRVFQRLSEAHALLADDDKRDAYLRAHPELVRTVAHANTPQAPSADEQARHQERKARLAKHPYLARVGRTNELVASAREHVLLGDYEGALGELAQIRQLDPQSREAPALLVEAKRQQVAARAKDALGRGRAAVRSGDLRSALSAFRAATGVDPTSSEALREVARTMLLLAEELPEALATGQRAVELGPRGAENHFVFGLCQLAMGEKKLAKRSFEAALERDAHHADAQTQLKKLRWTF